MALDVNGNAHYIVGGAQLRILADLYGVEVFDGEADSSVRAKIIARLGDPTHHLFRLGDHVSCEDWPEDEVRTIVEMRHDFGEDGFHETARFREGGEAPLSKLWRVRG